VRESRLRSFGGALCRVLKVAYGLGGRFRAVSLDLDVGVDGILRCAPDGPRSIPGQDVGVALGDLLRLSDHSITSPRPVPSPDVGVALCNHCVSLLRQGLRRRLLRRLGRGIWDGFWGGCVLL
jgi:hypothetical protein